MTGKTYADLAKEIYEFLTSPIDEVACSAGGLLDDPKMIPFFRMAAHEGHKDKRISAQARSRIAFDALMHACMIVLADGRDTPEHLRRFAADVRDGTLTRPPGRAGAPKCHVFHNDAIAMTASCFVNRFGATKTDAIKIVAVGLDISEEAVRKAIRKGGGWQGGN